MHWDGANLTGIYGQKFWPLARVYWGQSRLLDHCQPGQCHQHPGVQVAEDAVSGKCSYSNKQDEYAQVLSCGGAAWCEFLEGALSASAGASA